MDAPPPTVPARLRHRALLSPTAAAFMHRETDGEGWRAVSWREAVDTVDTLAANFTGLGVRPGDRIAIMLPTCPQWEYCHQAALAAGGVVVGLDSHDSEQNLRHVLLLTEPRALIVQTLADVERLSAFWPQAELFIIVERADVRPRAVHWLADLLGTTPQPPARSSRLPQPDDLATIIFTSGSTGQPKGIAYTHQQLLLATDALIERFPSVREGDRMVCWLPISNLFQRILNLFAMSCGATSYFVTRPEEVLRLTPDIRPTLFVGVPRFFDKLHGGIVAELERQPVLPRAMAHAAWAIGCRRAAALRDGLAPPPWVRLLHPLADKVLRRIRALLGPDLQFMVSGSAPLPASLLARFHGLGWLVLEAYGISENVMPVAINQLHDYRFGSVGRPLPGNELRFAADRELLLRGPGVFRGYYRDSAPSDNLDAEGFLHTGDYARLDEDGYLWLEGRKSEVFKTSTGRRIAPVPIEAALKTLAYVDHAVVVGRDQPFPVAVLTLDARHPRLAAMAGAALQHSIASDALAACAALPDHQRPGALIVSPHPLTVANGELTPNLKLRRRQIETRFSDSIDEAYRRAAQQPRAALTMLPVIEVP
ncbi:MAG: AMP-binding protein [Xanthomonadales bacterium]|nr:AMP-binding protein [Xanthomonadales bacterium]MBN8442517.1 AMP-binding protein [Thauera sp.]